MVYFRLRPSIKGYKHQHFFFQIRESILYPLKIESGNKKWNYVQKNESPLALEAEFFNYLIICLKYASRIWANAQQLC